MGGARAASGDAAGTVPPELQRDDVREYGRILWRRRWQVLLVSGGVLVAALLLTLLRATTYLASASVLVRANPVIGQSTVDVEVPNMETERALVMQSRIAQRVRATTAPDSSIDELQRGLDVDVVPDTEILVVTYQDTSPARAATLAQAFAESYVSFRIDAASEQITAAEAPVNTRIGELERRLAQLRLDIAATRDETELARLRAAQDSLMAQQALLEERLLDLRSTLEVARRSATIVSNARPTPETSATEWIRNGAIGLLAGLALGVGVALVSERLHDRAATVRALHHLGIPILGSIPRIRGWRPPDESRLELGIEPDSDASESYRLLADNVLTAAARERARTVLVTSAVDGEGKTTTSSNLAVALAERGKSVLAVSADLRHPRLHEFFGLENDRGLADLQRDAALVGAVAREAGIRGLRVIVSGSADPERRRLGVDAMSRVFRSLQSETADLVVVDAPAVLQSADAAILASFVDAVIIVTDGDATPPTVERAISRLRRNYARIIGAVYNNVDPDSSEGSVLAMSA